ncbi:MAG TPA: DUF222 domain-containing protein [Actinomycetes bacterium]|nr:DUF222 domain-containing protein [Actinomycetes bacterium]
MDTADTVDTVDTADGATLDRADLTLLTSAELEDRLSRLSARIAAAECELLLLLGEFDARQGWGECGMKSAAHWLSWRTGMRLGVAREKVRVARALRHLPRVRAAFAAGRLSYCKVRALSRVATEPTEAELVEIALGATGAQLERILRAWPTCLVAETSASSHVRRGLSRREEDDGSVVFTLRVAPEEAAVVDKAIAAARAVVLDDEQQPVETPEETSLAALLTDEPPAVRAEADAVVLMAESFLANGVKGQPGDRHLMLVHADLDTLVAAVEGRDDVSAETRSTGTAVPLPAGSPVEQRSAAARPAGCTLPDGQKLSPSTVLRLLCQSPAQLMVRARDGRPLDLGRTRRHATVKQRRALAVRDGCCRFPGCTQRRRLIPHHTVWWSRGGRTDLDLLVLLCPTHHRAVHEVGYAVEALGDGRFAWRRPSGAPIPDVPRHTADTTTGLPAADATADTIAPTWGGGRLDLDHLIGGMAANLMLLAGHRLTDVPYPAMDPALRAAAGWPEPRKPPPWQVAPAA